MGYGDELIGSGIAKGAANRGKRIAFGNRVKILWSQQAHEIYRGNPNVAPPGSENDPDIEWVQYYSGRRFYATQVGNRWQFHDYRCTPGEIFFTQEEQEWASCFKGLPFFVLEPRVKPHGACVGANKQWPIRNYQILADMLRDRLGYEVFQLAPSTVRPLLDIPTIRTPTFRHALSVLQHACMYIGPEGGLHHGAAAVATQATVIWGGFNTPRSTGYDFHTNIVAPGEPCGRISECDHCRKAMASITPERVYADATAHLIRREAV